MGRLVIASAAACLVCFAQTPARAQAPTAPPTCDAPEFRAFDFWVGDWDLDFDAAPGVLGHASNRITKDEYGPCVIAEHFELPATRYKGGSYSIYDRNARVWRQSWVDNQGGVFNLVGGPVSGQPYVFELRTNGPAGPGGKIMRMIWQDVTPDSLTWHWQAQQPDGSWKDNWVLRYKRHKAGA
ncbi:MAG TPA: hypothetical protein VG407_13860 [Caulobacteraceae bacterium]|jgi:hypothetical protein|nr:hypothetical protein [Caulobacteraceae bacterium]